MSLYPRLRPVLGFAQWCGFALAAFVASVVGLMGGTLFAAWVRS